MSDEILPSAIRRRRHARLARLEQRNDAARMLRNGYDRAEVIRTVDIDTPTLARIERSIARFPLPILWSVEETILAADIEDHERTHLTERLAGFTYDPTVPENAPVALDDALRDGLLTPDERERIGTIRAAVRRAEIEGWHTPTTVAADLKTASSETDDDWAITTIHAAAADLRAILRSARDLADAWHAEPLLAVWSGHRATRPWNALLAAFISHEFERYGDTPPSWTSPEIHELDGDWFPSRTSLEAQDELRQTTPSWLARRRLFLTLEDYA